MRKVTFIMLALAIMGGVILSGCKKNKDEQPTPVVTDEYTVVYQIKNPTQLAFSDCFKFDVSYTNSDGTTVEEKAVSGLLKTITVKAPFTAKIEGKIVYNEAELPTENIVIPIDAGGIGYAQGSSVSPDQITISSSIMLATFNTLEKFKNYIAENPEDLNFSMTEEIK